MRIQDLVRRLRTLRPRPAARSVARHLFKSRLLAAFLALGLTGFLIGVLAPDAGNPPEADLFRGMSVESFRDSPSDTTAHFVVDLRAGGRVFRRYDVDAAAFTAAPRARDYNRTITGTVYGPIELRGHVTQGLWLDVPRMERPLLPEQFDEVYRATLDFVKPVTLLTNVVGTLSGYSIGYRLATWNRSLHSRAVQERVLADPGLGRRIAREAWRRVLLEPLVTGAEDDAKRFAATAATQRIYTNFFRIALNDSDGFIPREADRLARLGHFADSRAMLAFAATVRRAGADEPVTSADFDAIEHWASLLVRRGHWAAGTIPPPGEERARYLGTLAWYGVAPPSPEAERVWVGPRLLVREGDLEGYVADDVPATGVGCPAVWRIELARPASATGAWAEAWLDGHAEFRALVSLASSAGRALGESAHRLAVQPEPGAPDSPVRVVAPVVAVPVANDRPTVEPAPTTRRDTLAGQPLPASPESIRASPPFSPDSLRTHPALPESTGADSVH